MLRRYRGPQLKQEPFADAAFTLPAYRAYFDAATASNAKTITLCIEGQGTATTINLHTVANTQRLSPNTIYNTLGQQLPALQHGQINIVSGRKTFLK